MVDNGRIYLLGGFKHFFIFHNIIYGIIPPIDELIFFKMVNTTNQMMVSKVNYPTMAASFRLVNYDILPIFFVLWGLLSYMGMINGNIVFWIVT
jgi:hypothetical protein